MRSIPATALVPLFLVFFGIGDTTKVFAGAFSSALVIALSVVAGLGAKNHTRQFIAKLYGVRSWRKLLFTDLPEAAPQLFVGLRAGISLALILVVITEMLVSSNHGLGNVISMMRYTDDKPRLYAAILVTGVIGYACNRLLSLLENLVVHWGGKT